MRFALRSLCAACFRPGRLRMVCSLSVCLLYCIRSAAARTPNELAFFLVG
jgi:hypothetical protein